MMDVNEVAQLVAELTKGQRACSSCGGYGHTVERCPVAVREHLFASKLHLFANVAVAQGEVSDVTGVAQDPSELQSQPARQSGEQD